MGDIPNWHMVCTFTIPGEPVPLARPRFTKTGVVYTDPKSNQWMRKVAFLAINAAARAGAVPKRLLPADAAVLLEVETVHKRPKNLFRKSDTGERAPKVSKPDLTNLIKGIEDGITLARCIWKDDNQVTDLRASKRWAKIEDRKSKTTEEPHTIVRVYTYDQP